MSGIPDNLGDGGTGLTPNGSSQQPSLRDHLQAMNGQTHGIGWTEAIAVSGDTVTLEHAGWVLAVDATAAAATGPKAIASGTPAAGQCQLVFDADGVPTLNFAGADAVTEIAIILRRAGKDLHDDV